ncbi:hypothetical protein TorRG33x02_159730, partial [Trema orientale]
MPVRIRRVSQVALSTPYPVFSNNDVIAAVCQYDACWLRYQDSSNFSPSLGIVPATSLQSLQMVTETERFNDLLSSAMNTVAYSVTNFESGG